MSDAATISVTIVSWNSARYLQTCLDSLAAQTQPPQEVVVVDNGSTDESAKVAEDHSVVTCVDRVGENLGFSSGQNRGIAQTTSEWVLALNPDTRLSESFLADLITGVSRNPEARIGTLCGKLLRMDQELAPIHPSQIDSAGMEMFRSFRHLDRGSGAVDNGFWDAEQKVFGASGAAALYRRAMIEDVRVDGSFFDPEFFAYREDADVAWRAQILGWDCLYVPAAIGYHVRSVVPERRSEVSDVLNRYSVRNRFLMRWKNADFATWRHCGWRGVFRDLTVVAACLFTERSSLPGLGEAVLRWGPARRQHRWIEEHRRRSSAEVMEWFQ